MLCWPKYKLFKLLTRLLHIVIDDDLTVALSVGIFKFDFSLCKPFLNILFTLSTPTSETRLKSLKARWFDKTYRASMSL
ncbi:hypothetical protein N7534_008487 [Penicillium rubens]|nr:hypothetical protein N7534_008487 [Penicillium rubens]